MSNNPSFSWDLYHQAPIIGIIRGMEEEIIYQIAHSFQAAGLYNLEVTMNTAGAAQLIAALRRAFPALNIGAGTVCDLQDLEKALAADAQYIVAPIINEAVITTCVKKGIPVFPGAYTPTEIYTAWKLGSSAVKVFPANQLGVAYIKNVSAPLNEIKLLPTGGVSMSNIKSFFEAGAFGVGMGSGLLDKQLLAQKDFKGLTDHFIKLKSEIVDFTT